ncbi:MAG: YfhO family protein [Elusimicrobia bacterium]|nr:YfhO family protein [Elusimicrobiota bacterium]
MKRVLPALIIFCLISVFFWKAATLQGIFFTPGDQGNDIMNTHYAFRDVLHKSLRNFSIPLWTPHIFTGYPVFAHGEGGFFYPLNLVLFGLLPTHIAYNYSVLLSFFLAGIFLFMYLRSIGLGYYPSLFSAVAFCFSGFFIMRIPHINRINAACWAPLLFYFIERFLQKQQMKWIISAGIVLGLQFLAGAPQIAYYSFLVVTTYLLFRCWKIKGKILLFGKSILILGIVGIGLAAVQLIPTYELTRQSTRAKGVTYEYASKSNTYSFKNLITFVAPYFYDNPADGSYKTVRNGKVYIFSENCCYMGLITLILAVGSILLIKNSHIRYFWLLMIGSLLFVISDLPFYEMGWYVIPGFRFFRVPQRLLLFTALALSVLAGFSMEHILKVFPASGGSARGGRKLQVYGIIPTLAIVLLTVDLFVFNNKYNVTVGKEYLNRPETVKFLKEDGSKFRIRSLNPERTAMNIYNMFGGWDKSLGPYFVYRDLLPCNSNLIWNISSAKGYSPLPPARYKDMERQVKFSYSPEGRIQFDDKAMKILNLLGCKYLLSLWDIKSRDIVLRKKISYPWEDIPALKIYENKKVLPRAFILNEMPSLDSVLNIKGEAEFLLDEPHQVIIQAVTDSPGFLVLNDMYYPGWKVYVDGVKSRILPANYLFRAVELKKGTHNVRFVYRPYSFYIGMIISMITLLVAVVLLKYGRNTVEIR